MFFTHILNITKYYLIILHTLIILYDGFLRLISKYIILIKTSISISQTIIHIIYLQMLIKITIVILIKQAHDLHIFLFLHLYISSPPLYELLLLYFYNTSLKNHILYLYSLYVPCPLLIYSRRPLYII